jgi:hypothetical protein
MTIHAKRKYLHFLNTQAAMIVPKNKPTTQKKLTLSNQRQTNHGEAKAMIIVRHPLSDISPAPGVRVPCGIGFAKVWRYRPQDVVGV